MRQQDCMHQGCSRPEPCRPLCPPEECRCSGCSRPSGALCGQGRKRGFLMRGAQVDTQRMARVLLDEFRGGKLGRFTLETAEDAQ